MAVFDWSYDLNIIDLIIAASAFGLVLAVWLVCVLLWRLRRSSQDQRIKKRLGLAKTEAAGTHVLRLWHDGKEAVTTAQSGQSKRLSLKARAERLIKSAGWVTPPRTILLGLLGIALLMFVVPYAITGNLLAGAAGATASVLIFTAYLKRSVVRIASRFERQFVDALGLAARSLRAGHPLNGSLRLISEEVGHPVGTLFGEICQEHALGVSLEDALRRAATKSENEDMNLLAASVAIQMQSGGNLAGMMEKLSVVIRDRIRLRQRVRVLTAQTQFSKRILTALPLVAFLVLNILNPSYMQPLYTTTMGHVLLLLAGGGLVLGVFVMNRMTVIRT